MSSSEDDVICGGEQTTVPAPAAHRRKRAAATICECWLCGDAIVDECRELKGCSFHVCCMNAVRSHRRQCRIVSLLCQQEADTCMLTDRAAFQASVSPLIVLPGRGSRSVVARQLLKKKGHADEALRGHRRDQ